MYTSRTKTAAMAQTITFVHQDRQKSQLANLLTMSFSLSLFALMPCTCNSSITPNLRNRLIMNAEESAIDSSVIKNSILPSFLMPKYTEFWLYLT